MSGISETRRVDYNQLVTDILKDPETVLDPSTGGIDIKASVAANKKLGQSVDVQKLNKYAERPHMGIWGSAAFVMSNFEPQFALEPGFHAAQGFGSSVVLVGFNNERIYVPVGKGQPDKTGGDIVALSHIGGQHRYDRTFTKGEEIPLRMRIDNLTAEAEPLYAKLRSMPPGAERDAIEERYDNIRKQLAEPQEALRQWEDLCLLLKHLHSMPPIERNGRIPRDEAIAEIQRRLGL